MADTMWGDVLLKKERKKEKKIPLRLREKKEVHEDEDQVPTQTPISSPSTLSTSKSTLIH